MFFQVFIIGAIAYNIYKKKTQVLGISANPIHKENITSSPSAELKYYYEPKPGIETVSLNFLGLDKSVQYSVNSDSLNQIVDVSVQKTNEDFRIIALGDSFTFGVNVNTGENYPSQLQELLNNTCKDKVKFEVLNLGVPGYDIQYAVERFKRRGQKYDADLTLWLIIEGDLGRLSEKTEPWRIYYQKHLNELRDDPLNTDIASYYLPWNKARQRLHKELGGIENVVKINEKYLYDSSSLFNNSPLVILTFPDTDPSRQKILNSFSESLSNGYFYSGIPDIFSIEGAVLPDKHPTALGHKFIAEDIFDYLKKNKLISCN